MLSGMLTPQVAGRAFAALAESVLRAALAHVELAFARDHGRIPGGRCVVIGLGKLGSREMTATSDLDLLLLYDFDEDRPQSDGRRSLHAVQYFTRLTQRLVSTLTVATRRGRLYEVDMRLRPSGRQGPVATQLRSFLLYQANEAETWERMSLCRARVVAGDPSLAQEAREAVTEVVAKARDAETLRRDVVAMRQLIASEKGDREPWDLKLVAGGLLDLEFIAQYLILRYAHDKPNMLRVETEAVLAAAGEANVLAVETTDALIAAHRLYTAVMQMIRLTTDGIFDPARAAAGVLRRIAAAADLPDFRRLEGALAETRLRVRAAFDEIFKT
jgi:glutamate-ammonia-ligase adenylyltransferase